MNKTLLVGIIVAMAGCVLSVASAVLAHKTKRAWLVLLAAGAGWLAVVGLCHICEGGHWLSAMQWGQPHSAGHYLDLTSCILALASLAAALFGFVLARISAHRRRAPPANFGYADRS